ncbi:CLUMA_CG000469, isoform A [Clunio marinus]|uniref:CLUMA_CG000469, isoform A n=1 Tax=Clunio marinus TaxID=568069 RepID=A0A1J1HK61_9DIPT|nr:CLUMA_CG000469, isoform A [Clunio marinus]
MSKEKIANESKNRRSRVNAYKQKTLLHLVAQSHKRIESQKAKLVTTIAKKKRRESFVLLCKNFSFQNEKMNSMVEKRNQHHCMHLVCQINKCKILLITNSGLSISDITYKRPQQFEMKF